MSATDALLINMRIAIVDESIFQNVGQQYYARGQENGCSPNMNKPEEDTSMTEAKALADQLSGEVVLARLRPQTDELVFGWIMSSRSDQIIQKRRSAAGTPRRKREECLRNGGHVVEMAEVLRCFSRRIGV